MSLNAPFPYSGGKRKVAPAVWQALGDPYLYIEPFGGSAAVLLARPSTPRIEVLNDVECHLINTYRAIKMKPVEVLWYTEWCLSHVDLMARGAALITARPMLKENLLGDPEFYDTRLAGWWLWGMSTSISPEFGIPSGPWVQDGQGGLEQRPGQGVKASTPTIGRPKGINGWTADPASWLNALASRLRSVIILFGDWKKSIAGSALAQSTSVGVFLDPPYGSGDLNVYDSASIDHYDMWRWANEFIAGATDKQTRRVVIAGYEAPLGASDGWSEVAWENHGGRGVNAQDGNDNRKKERLWLSPGCLL